MYRIEIDALNALIKEQQKTNELLTQLMDNKPEKPIQTVKPTVKPQKRTYQRRKAQ